jgi:hypothetical protein
VEDGEGVGVAYVTVVLSLLYFALEGEIKFPLACLTCYTFFLLCFCPLYCPLEFKSLCISFSKGLKWNVLHNVSFSPSCSDTGHQ